MLDRLGCRVQGSVPSPVPPARSSVVPSCGEELREQRAPICLAGNAFSSRIGRPSARAANHYPNRERPRGGRISVTETRRFWDLQYAERPILLSSTAAQEDLQWVLSGLVPWTLPSSSGSAKQRFVRRNRDCDRRPRNAAPLTQQFVGGFRIRV